MKLPNGDRAIVDIEKLRSYCLDPSHPRGRHKARVFMASLGIAVQDAETLRADLLRAATTDDAEVGQSDKHGTRYTLDCRVGRGVNSAFVRSHWIVRKGEDVPRLVTCYVN
ncbi:MAG: hypothetical protein IT513_05920 [Burkholderiales bacterium]|nr:hypothetical protein [Burkholderiales bacterium]